MSGLSTHWPNITISPPTVYSGREEHTSLTMNTMRKNGADDVEVCVSLDTNGPDCYCQRCTPSFRWARMDGGPRLGHAGTLSFLSVAVVVSCNVALSQTNKTPCPCMAQALLHSSSTARNDIPHVHP